MLEQFKKELSIVRKYVGSKGKLQELNLNKESLGTDKSYAKLQNILETNMIKMIIREED